MPQYTRQNVWKNGGDFDDPVILAYAQGVAGMKARALATPTSWRFYGAIHGFDPDLWQQLGYFDPNEPQPSDDLIAQFWKQCQHGSWYFEPWHRGYLIAIEANIRAIVQQQPNAPANWALPYWNYFNPNENQLPPAFARADWPGDGPNPLYVAQRYGPNNDGNVYVPVDQINLDAMQDPDFTGVASGGSPGFGGVDTGFEHGGPVHGGIETQPHDYVHGLVGGADPNSPDPNNPNPGLMSDPDTAGLDPIFYLHHANIDRLWQVWRQNPSSHVDPPDPNWVDGPGNIQERIFAMPMPPNGDAWNYTPGQMSDFSTLDYTYDDLSPQVAVQPHRRLQLFGAAPELVKAQGAAPVPSGKNVELMGASPTPLKLSGAGEVRTAVQLDTGVRQKVTQSFAAVPETAKEPDRVFLNLENVTGLNDSTAFQVYVGLPQGASPADHPELRAGSIALFGVRKASLTDDEHAGKGLTFVLEITKIVDALHLSNSFNLNSLDVRIVPVRPIPEGAKIQIGRVSIFRQGS
ncbi:MAG: tyrosinase family protein [Candidatus Eremiobacteraeota bacterium]|nr:tyrosinase family protein [Candidatus Eremiobacteraeota bacterium]